MNSYYSPNIKGGAEVVVQLLAEGLVANEHKVHVIATCDKNTESSVQQLNGVQIHHLPIQNIYWPFISTPSNIKKILWHILDNWNPFTFLKLKSIIKKIAPDVVVTHNLAGFSTSVWALCRILNIPVVQVVHDYYLACTKSSMYKGKDNCRKQCYSCSKFRLGVKQRSKSVDAVIFVSEFLQKKFTKMSYFNSAPQFVIHNSISLKSQPIKTNLKESSEKLVLGFIGRITPEKGIETLLKAFSSLAYESKLRLELKVAGEGSPEYMEYLKSEYGSFADFLGKVDASAFYNMINVCIVPPLWDEPFGLVAVEALNAGVPVLASRSGGLTEIVTDRVNGLFFEPGDVSSLLIKINELAFDDDLYSRLLQNTINSSKEFTDVNAFVKQHEKQYQAAINAHRKI